VLSVVTDRSQGGSSQANGELELMVQRRLQHDDNRGVAEPLNETGLDGHGLIVRGTHRVSIRPGTLAGATRRGHLADMLFPSLQRFAYLPGGTVASWLAAPGHAATYTGLTAPLPANVHLLTVHSWSPGVLLVRLAHSFETGEDATLSAPATVNLAGLFPAFNITSVEEMTVSGNQPLAGVPPITYTLADGSTVTLPVVPTPPAGAALTVTLTPMQIRTFMVTTI